MGRLILLYERGRKTGGGPSEDLGRSIDTGGDSESDSEGRSGEGVRSKSWVAGGGGEAADSRGAGSWETTALERGRGSGADEIRLEILLL